LKLIAGLGNPGAKYAHTRHNAGFMIIDYFAGHFNIPMKDSTRLWVAGKGLYENEEVCFLKPTTYMNNSGEAVSTFIDENNINLQDLLVVVDDFQLPFGTIRVRARGTDGGHNGLASISYYLMSDEYPRMRIGIGRDEKIDKSAVIDFVLDKFTEPEKEKFDKLLPVYSECITSFIKYGVDETMNKFNKSFLPPETEDNSHDLKNNFNNKI
jgi:PTH1 family peptidyl-tRNA hydrolase